MHCRQDLISYYQKAPRGYWEYLYVVEAARELARSHDFASGPLVIPDANNIDAAFLKDSTRYWGAAMLQFLAHSYLDAGGYITWAEVTRYYSRYFAVVAFTRLNGYATLWLSEWKDLKKQGEKQFWVLRTNEQQHTYLIGLRSHLLKVSEKMSDVLPYRIPPGSGSHKTTWLLLSEICKSWDEEELHKEAAFPTPQQSASFLDLWDSYEERMMEELEERSRRNYLNEEVGFFFGELDGISRWKEDGIGWWFYHPNPLSESVPMEDTYEHKMAWSTIRYVASILVETPARTSIEWYLKLIEKAPANDEMKAQVTSELESLLKMSG